MCQAAETPRTISSNSVQSDSSAHYLIKLHDNLASVNSQIAANLGLSGLGLAINGNVSLLAGFDATLGFGISSQYGFYVRQHGHGRRGL